jgi:hypothetical protein
MSKRPPYQQTPHLNSDLRLALSILYNLPLSTSVHERPTSSQAHEYLLHFQSRNARRRLQSQPRNQALHSTTPTLNSTDIGSTWLSCVFLILSLASNVDDTDDQRHRHQVHYAEALFAAQTMFHRLRRVKLSEAIDVEFEPIGGNPENMTFSLSPQHILELYRAWVLRSCSHSLSLIQLIQEYQPSINHFTFNNSVDIEERIKGEISMLVLANALNDISTATQLRRRQTADSFGDVLEGPLLSTLSSALTTIAARMRYTPSFLPDPAPNTQPIVNMILGSISMVQSRRQYAPQCSSGDLYYVCLMAIPDAVLQPAGGGGGAYGRFSLEQRCFAALTKELKTQGMVHVWQCLQEIESTVGIGTSPVQLFQLFEAWANHVPLPIQVVERSIPWLLQSWQVELSQEGGHLTTPEAKAAMAYWIAIMESGALTVDQVLLSSLVQSREKSNQPNKKRQSSKSKRKDQQLLEERTTSQLLELANEEVKHRGQIACAVAKATWPVVVELLSRELRQIGRSCSQGPDKEHYDDDVEGGGPVGAISACATACLPHMLRESSAVDVHLFLSISQAIRQICASPSRPVRSFASESLYTLHETLTNSSGSSLSESRDLFDSIVAHFFHCSTNLALGCRYPDRYFEDLGKTNDDDLENERNDVRDLLRTVAAIPSLDAPTVGVSSSVAISLGASVLLNIMKSCALPIQEAAHAERLFPEFSLHIFSALAKPINACASLYKQKRMEHDVEERFNSILWLALKVSSLAGSSIIRHFLLVPTNDILPFSRLFNLALASLSPMLSTLVDIPNFQDEVVHVLAVTIEASGTSLLRIPEVIGPSTLRSCRFDIRGAMRSPGGEDHSGVITLLRLSNENEDLSLALLRTKGSVVIELCSLHDELKQMEIQRGAGIFHGVGVFPKSRRILIGIICHLEAVSGGKAGGMENLKTMFDNLLSTIATFTHQLESLSHVDLHRLCEMVFDAGAFSPSFVSTLFDGIDNDGVHASCLRVLHESGIFGFRVLNGMKLSLEAIHQWNRLRGALFILLTKTVWIDVPTITVPMLSSWIRIECEAALRQCSLGPTSSSPIFHEDIISEESVPPGLFIQLIASNLSSVCRIQVPLVTGFRNSVAILSDTRQYVLEAILSPCGCPVGKGSFHDPRPVLAETWLSCMLHLCVVASQQNIIRPETSGDEMSLNVKELLLDTFVAVVILLMYGSLEKTQDLRSRDPGMTLDGPQGLVMMEFLESYFKIGGILLQEVGRRLYTRIPVTLGPDPETAGVAIVGAVLFRGAQGSLPPWAVESVPAVYSALFSALDNNVERFVFMLEISMSLRLEERQQFGSVKGGTLLSGKYFENISDNAKATFLSQASDLAQANTATSWKRLKSLVKQVCGGKKKDTDFNQRPAMTRWDALDRI